VTGWHPIGIQILIDERDACGRETVEVETICRRERYVDDVAIRRA
jgi:hypothetical protein